MMMKFLPQHTNVCIGSISTYALVHGTGSWALCDWLDLMCLFVWTKETVCWTKVSAISHFLPCCWLLLPIIFLEVPVRSVTCVAEPPALITGGGFVPLIDWMNEFMVEAIDIFRSFVLVPLDLVLGLYHHYCSFSKPCVVLSGVGIALESYLILRPSLKIISPWFLWNRYLSFLRLLSLTPHLLRVVEDPAGYVCWTLLR